MKDNARILGFDIGGTNVRFGMVDEGGNLEHFVMKKSAEVFGKNPVQSLAEQIREYIAHHQDYRIEAIVAGFPSTIDRERKIVLSTPNIAGLDNMPVVDGLGKYFEQPVFLEKDVNLIFEYDMFEKKFDKQKIVLGFYIGTGFGNAIQVGGGLLVGKNGVAGELGHTVVLGDDKLCSCGNQGCMEGYASGKYLQEIHKKYFSDIAIDDIFTLKSKDEKIIAFIENLSAPIASEINIFDPDHIILGGGVLAMKNFPKALLEKFVLKHTRKPYPHDTLSFNYSQANQQSGVIGAGIYGYKQLGRL